MKTYADTKRERIAAANRAALALLDAYAEAIGEHPTEDDPETRAAYAVSHTENMTLVSIYATASDYDTIAAMVEAIDLATIAARHELKD